MKIRSVLCVTSALALSAVATSCSFNVFDFIDGPRGDAQLISAARAALDRGDFDQAVEYYQKLSGSAGDVAVSEQAFALLARHNVGMGAFASAFGTGGGGAGAPITSIANSIGNDAGEAARLDIAHALQKVNSITDTSLKGLVRFLSGLALISEMLAEGAADKTHLKKTDIATSPSACAAAEAALAGACGTTATAECGKPTGSALASGDGNTSFNLLTATDAQLQSATIAPTLTLIKVAIDQVNIGLGEVGSSGNLSGSVGDFTGAFGALAFAGDAPCFRVVLLNQDIGAN